MTVTDTFRTLVVEELSRRRAVIHVDLEQLRLGISPDVPLAVQQWHGIIAVNYPARACGVKRSDTVKEAREKCPDIKFVHVATFTANNPPAYHAYASQSTHKVSLDEYRRASRQIMDVIKRLCPTMRKASVDEAYLDATELVKTQILHDYDNGLLKLIMTQSSVMPIPEVQWIGGSRKGKETEAAAAGGRSLGAIVGEQVDTTSGWDDLQLRYAAVFARHVRETLYRELGYRSSAGIAHTRCLAKICSALNKPDQQTVMRQSQVIKFLRDFPISRIPSLGGKLGTLVEAAFDAQTAGDLAHYNIEQLAIKLGSAQAQHVYDLCRGIDDSPVVENSAPQTLTSAKTFQRFPVRSLQALDRWISMNSTDLWIRVAEEWEVRRRWPQSLTVSYTPENKPMRTRSIGFPPRQSNVAGRPPAEALADVARICLRQVAAQVSIFPMVGFMLTAKSFRKEMASASLMERWLTNNKQKTQNSQQMQHQQQVGPPSVEVADSRDEHNASDGRLGSDGLEYDCDDDFDLDFELDPDPGVDSSLPSAVFVRDAKQQQHNDTTAHDNIQRISSVPEAAPSAGRYQTAVSAIIHTPLYPPVSSSPAAIPELNLIPRMPAMSSDDPMLLTPGCASEYETSDTESSCLKTPQESDSEDCLSEASESAIPSGAVSVPEDNAMIDTTIPPAAAAAAASTRTTTDYGPPSRSTTVSSKHRTSVYIQPSVDLESAARYGEGYRHMNIDRHDDGSLVVASPEESQSDGFIPALIAATRRKREIQIIRFQHAIDAPDDAIGGTKASAVSAADAPSTSSAAAAAAIAATSTAAARGIGSGESISTGNPQAPESSFMASIRDKLETQQQKGKECANSSSSDDDNESADIVLDIAVNAMMESLSSSQSVMQIRCPQCPETAPTISSLDWDTHRDWHMARQLQERELRHETVAMQLQKAFNHDASGQNDSLAKQQRVSKKPRYEKSKNDKAGSGSNSAAAANSATSGDGGGESSGLKRRQKTISESWK
ncbi:N-acetyltransferase eso1 [Coemansia sp. IMI 203386]|nr:N-acetyltransferase eso1 [Coemansia sp. IMI 203386]